MLGWSRIRKVVRVIESQSRVTIFNREGISTKIHLCNDSENQVNSQSAISTSKELRKILQLITFILGYGLSHMNTH